MNYRFISITCRGRDPELQLEKFVIIIYIVFKKTETQVCMDTLSPFEMLSSSLTHKIKIPMLRLQKEILGTSTHMPASLAFLGI